MAILCKHLTKEWLMGDRDMALEWFNQLDYESRYGYENEYRFTYPINYSRPRWDTEVMHILDTYGRSTPGDPRAETDRNIALRRLDQEAARSETLERIQDENDNNLNHLMASLSI